MEVSRDGFIVVDITDDMIARATEKSDEMGVIRNSIRSGKGNLCGFLGEEVVLAAIPNTVSNNSYQHDIDLDGLRLEIKSKDRTVPPSPAYEASIAKYNDRQQADFYVFVSLLRNKTTGRYDRGYICGAISPTEYKRNAVQLSVGDVDPTNGWRVSADCHNLPYTRLAQLGSFIQGEE